MDEKNNDIKLKDKCNEIFETAKKIRERSEANSGASECSEVKALALDMQHIEMYVEELKKEKELLRSSLAASEEMERKLNNDIMVLEKENDKLKNTITNMSVEFFDKKS